MQIIPKNSELNLHEQGGKTENQQDDTIIWIHQKIGDSNS